MGNKDKNKRVAKKRSYRQKYDKMIEVVNKNKRMKQNGEQNEEQNQSGMGLHTLIDSSKLLHQQSNKGEPTDDNETIHSCVENQQLGMDLHTLVDSSELLHRQANMGEPTNEDEPIYFCDEIPDLADYNLRTSPHQPDMPDFKVGRRVINVSNFFEKLKEICNHGPLNCDIRCIELINETRNGLMSKYTFLCKMCKIKFVIKSDADYENYIPINNCALAGIISIGGGHSQLEEFLAALNLPLISNKVYQEIHDDISKNWKEVTQESMDKAAEKERNMAILEGRVSAKGTPIIDVIADGCYGKRSYRTNYSSLSGAGAIIGKKTGEILYLGVRNKYCFTCDRAEKKKETVKEHVCYKNYSGPSSGMETEIIVEGFKNSIAMHNLIYGRLISDGDSSTYNRIHQLHPYKNEGISVEKIECRNHLLRNFCSKLTKLQSDTHYPIKHRKRITKNAIMSLRSAVVKAIAKNKSDECPEVQKLFDDINLAHNHAFGDHSQCKSYFCDAKGEVQPMTDDFFTSSLWQRICLLTQNLAAHAQSLIHDVDSNIVERYHSIVAKLIGGKRLNFSLKQSYATRCHAAAASFNTKKGMSRLYKHITQNSPQGKLKMIEERRFKKRILNKKYPKKKRRVLFTKKDPNYGDQCQRPDMSDEMLANTKEKFLRSLKKTDSERDQIQEKTIRQRDCSEWIELRRSLLTASNFGTVIKRRQSSKCANMVKKIIYGTNLEHVASIKHGRTMEPRALKQLAQQENLKIEPCGLYIDKDLPFLGASPDGVSGDTIVELKCPITAHRLSLEEAVKKKKVTFWTIKKNGYWEINKTHNWYFQVQGQLHVTQMRQCLFAVWSSDNEALKTELIARDNSFWNNEMKEKLVRFYMDCMLPEIVDPRFTRNMPIREPTTKGTDGATKADEQNNDVGLISVVSSPSKPACTRYLNYNNRNGSSRTFAVGCGINGTVVPRPVHALGVDPACQGASHGSHQHRVAADPRTSSQSWARFGAPATRHCCCLLPDCGRVGRDVKGPTIETPPTDVTLLTIFVSCQFDEPPSDDISTSFDVLGCYRECVTV